jgi:YbbR domain-containing protein
MADTDIPLPPDAQTRQTYRRKLKSKVSGSLTENLWLKLTSVGLAALLWFSVTSKEPTAKSVAVHLRLRLDSSLVLRTAPPEINAVVQGTPSELLKLGDRSATIERQINAQAPDTLAIDLSADDVELPPNVFAKVTDIYPKRVALEFVPTLTRHVPVRSTIHVTTPTGASDPRVEIDPARVEISGPRLTVLRIAFVRTDSTSILATDSIPHQVAIDTAGLGVSVKPLQVRVRVILPQRSKRP